jgi:hypothetical protein
MRNMKNQILCAIDFSESSVQPLIWANKIALGMGAHLNILYSYRLIQAGNTADVLSFKRKTEEESKMKYAEIEKTAFNGTTAPKSFITEIGFFSDNIENFIRKNPSTVLVMSEPLAEFIYDHKNQTLMQFMKVLKVPLLVVPDGEGAQTLSRKSEKRTQMG